MMPKQEDKMIIKNNIHKEKIKAFMNITTTNLEKV